MKIYISARTARHERDFLVTFGRSCLFLGHDLVTDPLEADVSVIWGFDRAVSGQPTVFVEVGWIPRWYYQVSPYGLNSESHLRWLDWDVPSPAFSAARDHLWRMRFEQPPSSAYWYADPRGEPPKDLPEHFLLVPFQVEGDLNLRGNPIQTMQALVDTLSKWNPDVDLFFRGHPALIAQYDKLKIRRRRDHLDLSKRNCTVHQLLKSERCLGVVTINSNVAHDAIVWDKYVIALGRGSWPEEIFDSTLPKDLAQALWAFESGDKLVSRVEYVARMRTVQWIAGFAGMPEKVSTMLEVAKEAVFSSTRR